MVASIEAVRDAGRDGVVIGALTADGDVDVDSCRRMIDAAVPLSVTFHRAFDETTRPVRRPRCHRRARVRPLLTSGQADVAPAGAAMLRRLVEHAAGRLVVLAGGGVRADNVARLVAESGVLEVHFSFAGAGGVDATLAAARRA